jgi:hypothetical protein
MELDNLKINWQQYNSSLENSMHINQSNLDALQKQKINSKLSAVYFQNVIILFSHIIMLVFLAWFVAQSIGSFTYAMSGIVLIVFYIFAMINTTNRIFLIREISASHDIVTAQHLLLRLQLKIFQFIKLSVIFIPAFLAFPVVITKINIDYGLGLFGDFNIFTAAGGNWELAQIIASVICIPLGIWFYQAVSFENLDKKWVRKLIERISDKSISEALLFMDTLKK